MIESAEEARYGRAVRSFYENQLRIRREEQQRKLSSDRTEFNPEEHLIFSPPRNTWTLTDMELQYDESITSFALSGNFPLFSAEAIAEMRRELLSDTVRQKFQKSSGIVNSQLRGMVPEYV